MSLPARHIASEHVALEPERGPIEHAKTMPSFDYRSMMLDGKRKYSKSYFAQLREMYELKLCLGRIAPVEYYYCGLYVDVLGPSEGVRLLVRVRALPSSFSSRASSEP